MLLVLNSERHETERREMTSQDSKCSENPYISALVTSIYPLSLLHYIARREEKRKIKRIKKKNEMYGPSDAVFKQRKSRPQNGIGKNAWPALMGTSWIGLRITESPYKQLGSFADSRHCLRRMRCEERKSRLRGARGRSFDVRGRVLGPGRRRRAEISVRRLWELEVDLDSVLRAFLELESEVCLAFTSGSLRFF